MLPPQALPPLSTPTASPSGGNRHERPSCLLPHVQTGQYLMQLGYKLVFAVGSTDSVFIYDTGVLLALGAPTVWIMRQHASAP
jgi:hypothetical protein